MYLAEVETLAAEETAGPEIACCTAKWDHWPASTLSHHGVACCDIAREWVLATDFSQLGDAAPVTGPRWLRQKYPWGPSPWPLHWCDAVERERLDCGAHAAISHELFAARGVTSFPAQFVQQFSEDDTRHWGDRWNEEDVPAGWIDGDLIYHEGVAVAVSDDEMKLWDASAGWWVHPRQAGGYGALLAVRFFDPEGRSFRWGEARLVGGRWNRVGG